MLFLLLILLFSICSSAQFINEHGTVDVVFQKIYIKTDKDEYETGEQVNLFIYNHGNEKIAVSGPCILIYDDYDNDIAGGCMYLYFELEPGEKYTWTWNQITKEGNQVSTGHFTIKAIFMVNNSRMSDMCDFFIHENGRFCGYVYDYDKNPIENATINIDAVDCFWITDENGYYETGYHWMQRTWDLTAFPSSEFYEDLMPDFRIAEIDKGKSCWVNFTLVERRVNNPPKVVEIDGPSECFRGVDYEYILTGFEPEGDDLFFRVYWGDLTFCDFYNSDEDNIIYINRTWDELGEYTMNVQVVDEFGFYSEILEFDVKVVKNKNLIFDRVFYNRFLSLFPSLKDIMFYFQ